MALHCKLMDLGSYRTTSMTVSYLVLPLCGVFLIPNNPWSFLHKDMSLSSLFVRAQRVLILEQLLNIGFWINGSLGRGITAQHYCVEGKFLQELAVT